MRIIGVDAYGSVLKKYHETQELDPKEIYPYRIEGLGKNLIPSATDFDVIDKFVKVSDEDSAHSKRNNKERRNVRRIYLWCRGPSD